LYTINEVPSWNERLALNDHLDLEAMLEAWFEGAQGPADHHGIDATPLADVDLEAMLDAQAPGEAMADHHGEVDADGVGLEEMPVAVPVSLTQLLS